MKYVDIASSDDIFSTDTLESEEDIIKQSINNLILRNPDSSFFKNRGEGINLFKFLFEPISYDISHAISREIKIGLVKYEPRITNIVVETLGVDEENLYEISISYTIRDLLKDENVKIPLKTLR